MNNEQTTENFPLDDAAIDSLAELDQQERNINVARQAILSYFLRQQKLTGNWQLAQNRRELVKTTPADLPVQP
jgi:hypothetical protein